MPFSLPKKKRSNNTQNTLIVKSSVSPVRPLGSAIWPGNRVRLVIRLRLGSAPQWESTPVSMLFISVDLIFAQAWMIFTLPTRPLVNLTFIPWGWVADFVRISRTMPSVSFPLLWSCFSTMETVKPARISVLFVPSGIGRCLQRCMPSSVR